MTPQPLVRLELVRILAPLAILGFMAARVVHADHWISDAGFVVPDLGTDDYRQPAYLPPLPAWAAWILVSALVVSGVMTSLGAFTRAATLVFTLTLTWVALADRLAAFTVSKLGVVLALSLFLSPAGAALSIDARRRQRPAVSQVEGVWVRWFQLLVVVFYCASGICKARGDWLRHGHVIWTHLHDSYQTPIAWLVGKITPAWGWTVFQSITLAFEVGAPVWFALRWTRTPALVWGLAMHFMIGLMFGPVIWFSLLMMSLLVACFAPLPLLERVTSRRARPRPAS